jgi:hypothetical protein
MEWKEIRQHFPERWVLVEAIVAHSEGNKRVVESFAIFNVYPDSASAWQDYKQLHRTSPHYEYYIAHTSRQELEIEEGFRFGFRLVNHV